MNEEKFQQLQKDVNYLTEEGFVPFGKKLTVFRNSEDALNAIRNNEVEGVIWTAEDEIKYQQYLKLEALIEE